MQALPPAVKYITLFIDIYEQKSITFLSLQPEVVCPSRKIDNGRGT
jgi:hypothetical protein